jgi:molybdopterin molybdotransferase
VTGFDSFVMVDWSARSKPSPAKPTADAIWIAQDAQVAYHRTRAAAEDALVPALKQAVTRGQRVLLGLDFALGYPAGFASALTGKAKAGAIWQWMDAHITDEPDNANNRFEVAQAINATFPGVGPFWGRVKTRQDLPDLPWGTTARGGFGLAERRGADAAAAGAKPVWQLLGNGSVGSQVLMGLPMLHRLKQAFGDDLSVWPFEDHTAAITVVEIYPGLINSVVAGAEGIKDAVQVRLMAGAFAEMQARGGLEAAFAAAPDREETREEGWILGLGVEELLVGAARAVAHPDLQPPRLKNDCFALPPGVNWTPVDQALEMLRAALSPVVVSQVVGLSQAGGRLLAAPVTAARANPPAANTAVDGYGFAHAAAAGAGRHVLPLLEGQSAAGAPYSGTVPLGCAVRVLTGATLPSGVDTVVLQEDVTRADGRIAFQGPVKMRANTRCAGEDVQSGDTLLSRGHQLRAPDLALLAAVGLPQVAVFSRLRVGVLSTGDEIVAPGHATHAHQTHDANRPMLLELVARWNMQAVDLGHVRDDRGALRATLTAASEKVDVILTSGGASAGDEDHVSAILRAEGQLTAWRIALKPGRPLALAMWRGIPVFGLPGNPVAALVCALIFARPALSVLAGGAWLAPQSFVVPAAFTKSKKPGRREYLRARLNAQGHAEPFGSEGSGRISGLSWADGLIELEDGARTISQGDPVRFLPYSGFGI